MDPLSQMALGFGQSVGQGVGAAMVEDAKMPTAGQSGFWGDSMNEQGGGTFAGVALNFGSGSAATKTQFEAGLTNTKPITPADTGLSVGGALGGFQMDNQTIMLAAAALLVFKIMKKRGD